ncbi:hypothetical protein C1645_811142 [Glomus cerebriforme]|uniref:Uncharacterized protein n=1 Tax=Glomus cerebriforme TaxID=658196 RepID=A0A397TSW7_9GLOM|nr:hypothetical protein C1645_811142 [Glomus cerebriforme]
MGQNKLDPSPTDERSISLSTRPERENNSKFRRLKFGNCAETNPWTCLLRWRPELPIKSRTISVRTRENNATMPKLPELSEMIKQLNDDIRGYHENTDERLLHPEVREYFHAFGITGVHPHVIYGEKSEGRTCESTLLSREYVPS